MIVADIAAWLLAVPPIAMFGTFLAETVLGQMRQAPVSASGVPVRIVVLMPAHDEETGLAQTIKHVVPNLPLTATLLVIADNCSDRTATIARDAGIEVIERHCPEERGKGYALAFGRDHLRKDPPDCIIVVDADCVPEPGALGMLAGEAMRTGRPTQACYQMTPDLLASPMVQISNFAFLVKNLVRQKGAARLGGPALLTGTGMAFPWQLLEDAPLASGNIVEDLALGVHFVRAGHAPRFVEQARVWSAAASEQDTLVQRTRWEHGFIATARSHGLPLLAEGIGTTRWSTLWLGMHMLVPPLALLFVIGMAALAVTIFLTALGASGLPAALLAMLMTFSACAVLGAWARFGRKTLKWQTLLRLPLYMLWKAPVYLGLARGAETGWTRTKRSGE